MANYYVDFVGLNTFIYEPVGFSIEEQESVFGSPLVSGQETVNTADVGLANVDLTQNTTGYPLSLATNYKYIKNFKFSHDLPTTASHFPALMLHRNGPYGWPSFKSMRLSENPLTRKQCKITKCQ